LEQPEELSRLVRNHALNHRVSDPFQFVAGVLDHLPACADGLLRYRSRLLSQIYAGLAMRNYGVGNIAKARHQLAEAIALSSSILTKTEDFARLLSNCAVYLYVSAPILYVDTVLQNLPAQAQRLGRVRARVLGYVNVELACRDYFAGRQRLAVRRILMALRYRPFLIRRRRVVSTFLRSLPGLVNGRG
jgi:hypothetical protein